MTSLSDYAKPEVTLPGHYRVIEKISEGVNGAIFRCLDETSTAEVVLKRFDSQQRGAYLREMAASFGMSHPNVVHCLDTFYLADGSGWMVYEYLPDGSLRELLQECRQPPHTLVLKCLREVLSALEHLHQLGLIHCDIKPENIFLRRGEDATPDFVLGDLGAASFVREANEGRHTTGSPAYAAPERLFDRFSYNSDLYSVGVIAFEMLTGQRPFTGTPMEIYRAQLNQTPPLENIDDPGLCDLVEQLLQKDPHRRLPSAASALHLLSCIEQGLSIPQPGTHQHKQRVSWQSVPRLLPTLAHLAERDRFAVKEPPIGVLSMASGAHPLVGLNYEQHVAFWQGGRPATVPVVLHSGSVQLVTPDTLVYATGSRLIHLNTETRVRDRLVDQCRNLLAFHYHDERLLWCNHEGGYLHDLYSNTVVSYRSTLYFLYPQLRVLDEGWFLASAGPANQQVVLRNAEAQVMMRWNLNGPVIGWTHLGARVLVLCMDMENHDHYTLWHLSLDEAVAHCALNTLPRQWCFSAGYLFWFDVDGDLYRYDVELQALKLGHWDLPLQYFSVSPDHRFITGLQNTNDGQTVVTVWENMDSD